MSMNTKPFYWRSRPFNLAEYLKPHALPKRTEIPTQQRATAWKLIQQAEFVASSDPNRQFMQQILEQSRRGIKPTVPQMREVHRIIRFGDGFKLARWDTEYAQRAADLAKRKDRASAGPGRASQTTEKSTVTHQPASQVRSGHP